ncbi:MAG: alpha-amylase family protein [Bacteroidales bacterium]
MKSVAAIAIFGGLIMAGLFQCRSVEDMNKKKNKIVIYQVLPRLFGNTNSTNKPWGTMEENGVGKFNDFTDRALKEIRELGVTHIWYTGVLHHCVIGDYTALGISNDDPDVVKGRAGSPYAVRDYYNVNPDLAVDPAKRLEEFEALIERTHKQGLKVIIDIVPNHVARNYQSLTNPPGVKDFGADDDTTVVYARHNNFYYIPGEKFQVPDFEDGYLPLGGEEHPLLDGQFDEYPAKWTGNGSRSAKPSVHDWYETVKINFGVTPEGEKDFPELPENYAQKPFGDHVEFWSDKEVPDSWKKFEQIAHYWLEKGVDGFRYDMAQMVPVEFWSYLNSSIRVKRPDALLLSEIYVPEIYRDYIHMGKMDYLYDKVALYDTLKNIIRGEGSTDNLVVLFNKQSDIEHHLLHFLENHDEHRLAAPEFAGDPAKGKPAMVLSATTGTSPTMIYFGQEVGEKGEGDAGFGKSGRTTIFDYWGVPAHQGWMNNGAFDGGGLSEEQKALREFYKSLLNFTITSEALTGNFAELHTVNRQLNSGYSDKQFVFLRWKGDERLLIFTNFDSEKSMECPLEIPGKLVQRMGLNFGSYILKDALGSTREFRLEVSDHKAVVLIYAEPLESFILPF